MKVRAGFVSNSSSSSFVVSLAALSEETRRKINHLTDMSDDLSRYTGVIWDIDGWLKMFSEDSFSLGEEDSIRLLMAQYDDLVIIRESDEGMNGLLKDVGLTYEEIADKSLLEFEYH